MDKNTAARTDVLALYSSPDNKVKDLRRIETETKPSVPTPLLPPGFRPREIAEIYYNLPKKIRHAYVLQQASDKENNEPRFQIVSLPNVQPKCPVGWHDEAWDNRKVIAINKWHVFYSGPSLGAFFAVEVSDPQDHDGKWAYLDTPLTLQDADTDLSSSLEAIEEYEKWNKNDGQMRELANRDDGRESDAVPTRRLAFYAFLDSEDIGVQHMETETKPSVPPLYPKGSRPEEIADFYFALPEKTRHAYFLHGTWDSDHFQPTFRVLPLPNVQPKDLVGWDERIVMATDQYHFFLLNQKLRTLFAFKVLDTTHWTYEDYPSASEEAKCDLLACYEKIGNFMQWYKIKKYLNTFG